MKNKLLLYKVPEVWKIAIVSNVNYPDVYTVAYIIQFFSPNLNFIGKHLRKKYYLSKKGKFVLIKLVKLFLFFNITQL